MTIISQLRDKCLKGKPVFVEDMLLLLLFISPGAKRKHTNWEETVDGKPMAVSTNIQHNADP